MKMPYEMFYFENIIFISFPSTYDLFLLVLHAYFFQTLQT